MQTNSLMYKGWIHQRRLELVLMFEACSVLMIIVMGQMASGHSA